MTQQSSILAGDDLRHRQTKLRCSQKSFDRVQCDFKNSSSPPRAVDRLDIFHYKHFSVDEQISRLIFISTPNVQENRAHIHKRRMIVEQEMYVKCEQKKNSMKNGRNRKKKQTKCNSHLLPPKTTSLSLSFVFFCCSSASYFYGSRTTLHQMWHEHNYTTSIRLRRTGAGAGVWSRFFNVHFIYC